MVDTSRNISNSISEIKDNGHANHLIPDTVSSILLSLSIVFNCLGIYLLYQLKDRKTKYQRILLIFLSLSNISIALSEIVYLIGEWSGFEEKGWYLRTCDIITNSLFFTYYLVLFMLTFMRLLSCVMVFSYQRIIKPKTLVLILGSFWVIGAMTIIPFFFVSLKTFLAVWYKYIFPILDFIVLATVTVTYSFVSHALYKTEQVAPTQEHQKQYVTVTFLIIMNFLLFVVAPDIYFAYRFTFTDAGGVIEERVVMSCWQLNYILDPLIYIFFQRTVRGMLYQKARFLQLGCKRTVLHESDESVNTASEENVAVVYFKRSVAYRAK